MVCPSCGAPLGTGNYDHCEYCGCEVKRENYGWILEEFGVIKPDTQDEGVQQ